MRAAVGSTPRRRLSGCGLLLCVMLALAPAAGAQDLTPQVDRNSPAGVEYQLPIQRARAEATGASATPGAAAGEAPLFGVGVQQRPPEGTRRATGKRAGSGGARATGADGGVVAEPPLATSTPEIVRTQAAAPGDAGGGLLRIAATGAGVLLLGAMAGLAWRRRAQRR